MVLAAVLASLVFASTAHAEPIPIRHDRAAEALALAGPDVLVMSERGERGVRLVAVPRTGGKARTLLTVTGADLSFGDASLVASAQRVGVAVEIHGRNGRPDEYRVYSGPPSGPLRMVRRTEDPDGEAWTPYDLSVDGDRLLVLEGIVELTGGGSDEEDQDAGEIRAQILDSSGWHPIAWASSTRVPVAIAGAYAATVAYQPRRFEVVDLATGTPLATLTGEVGEPLSLDLESDGRIAVAMRSGIEMASPAAPQRNVANSGRLVFPRFAGPSIAAFDDARNTLALSGADWSWRPLGPRSSGRGDMEADGQGVAWLMNGCVRYAPLAPAAPTAENPCPASEVALYTIGPKSKLRGNRARVPVRCVASESGRCRGRLVVRLDYGKPIVARGTFNLPANDEWISVPVHFNRSTVAKFHRAGWGGAIVNAIVRDGTVGSGGDYSAEFSVEVDDRSA